MEKLINNITKGTMVLLMILSVFVVAFIIVGSVNEKTGEDIPNVTAINIGFYICYVLLGLALFIAAISMMLNTIMNPKKSLGSIIGVGFFVLVYFIANSMASGDLRPEWLLKGNALYTEDNAKFSETGLYVMYVFSFLSVIAILAGEMYSIYKKYLAK